MAVTAFGQPTPELLYYRFDGTGTTVPNLASAPPVGTGTAAIMGSLSQGAGGQCGGALIGSGNASSTDYLNTNYAPNLTGSWTISMYTKDITPSSTLFYIFGDPNSSSFRCFTNGVAGADNWILRGPVNDVLVPGGATVAPHVTTFVYDQPAGVIRGYLDGVLVATVAQPGVFVLGPGPFKVMGYGTNVGAPAGGKLDEFRWYDRALTAAEVMSLNEPRTYSTINPVSCGSFVSPSGNVLSVSGMYMDTIPNSGGCDSVITINLTVNQPSSASFSATVCSAYTAPSGAVFTTSGIHMDTIANAVGCDSVITINLTVNQPSAESFTVSNCEMYTLPNGATVTSSGIYMDTIPNMAGCDSVMTFDVTILEPTASSITASACESYVLPGGMTVTSTGIYMDTIPNMAGCDSVITVDVTINMPNTGSVQYMMCQGDVYTAPSGATYTASGTYMDTISTTAGCDSVITIALNVTTVNTNVTQSNNVLTAAATGVMYQWVDCNTNMIIPGANGQTFTATQNGSYAVIIMDSICLDSSACFTVVGIGINESQFASAVRMYPNPNMGVFNIDLGGLYNKVTVEITDVTGRTVYAHAETSAQLVPVNLDAAAGVYTVTVTADGHKAALRLVKE